MRDWRVETERILLYFPDACFDTFVLNKGLRWLHDKTLSFPTAFPMTKRLGEGPNIRTDSRHV